MHTFCCLTKNSQGNSRAHLVQNTATKPEQSKIAIIPIAAFAEILLLKYDELYRVKFAVFTFCVHFAVYIVLCKSWVRISPTSIIAFFGALTD